MTNPLSVPVSLFYPMRGASKGQTPHPIRDVNLYEWLTKSNDYLLIHQEKVRKNKDNLSRKRSLKNGFYAMIPSGTFLKQGDDAMLSFSGFISIDIDHVDPIEAKSKLPLLPYIAYAGLSVSGDGVWALVRIPSISDFKARYAALAIDVKEKVGFDLDKSCSNVSRFRCYSFDPDAYFNLEAQEFTGLRFEPKVERREPVRTDGGNLRLSTLIRIICETGVDITGNRNNWLKIGGALAGEFSENGRSYFHDLSQFHSKYSAADTDKTYDWIMNRGKSIDVDIIFGSAKRCGVWLK